MNEGGRQMPTTAQISAQQTTLHNEFMSISSTDRPSVREKQLEMTSRQKTALGSFGEKH